MASIKIRPETLNWVSEQSVIITGASTGTINFITDKLNVFWEAGNQLSYIIPISFAI